MTRKYPVTLLEIKEMDEMEMFKDYRFTYITPDDWRCNRTSYGFLFKKGKERWMYFRDTGDFVYRELTNVRK